MKVHFFAEAHLLITKIQVYFNSFCKITTIIRHFVIFFVTKFCERAYLIFFNKSASFCR